MPVEFAPTEHCNSHGQKKIVNYHILLVAKYVWLHKYEWLIFVVWYSEITLSPEDASESTFLCGPEIFIRYILCGPEMIDNWTNLGDLVLKDCLA